MKKSSFLKIFLLLIIVLLVGGGIYAYNNLMPSDFTGEIKYEDNKTDYSSVEKYLADKDSDIIKVTDIAFTATNDTPSATFGGAVRYGVLIYGEDKNGQEKYILTNDVKVMENDDIKNIRDYITAIPYDGSDSKDITIDVTFLDYKESFEYHVIKQDMSNKNTKILVNPFMPVGTKFEAYDTEYVGRKPVSTLVAEQLQDMFDAAAKEEGYDIWINSGYRSVARQTALYNRAVAELGPNQNDTAKPGASEHHTGFAVDLTWTNREGLISNNQVYDDEYDWLMENAHKYGFILRYTKGYEDVTQYMFEPWHYRYIGVELATQYHEEGWETLEEFFCIPR